MLSLNRRKALFAAIASPFAAKKVGAEVVSEIATRGIPFPAINTGMDYYMNSAYATSKLSDAVLDPALQLAADEAKVQALRAMNLDSTLEEYVRNRPYARTSFIFRLKSVSPAIQELWANDLDQKERMKNFYSMPRRRYMNNLIENTIAKLKMDWWP